MVPTGGGKTEATWLNCRMSFYRRLNQETVEKEFDPEDTYNHPLHIASVDRRSIRRLVRACGAMNMVANEHNIGVNVGFAPFRVGMWIGRETSPNRFFADPDYPSDNTAEDIIGAAKDLELPSDCTVSQFPTCPWCGDKSVGEVENYQITTPTNTPSWAKNKPILSIKCKSKSCPFSEGVPFTCVDEDMYFNPPSILLGVE